MAKFLDNVGLTKLVELIKGSLPGKATSSTLGLVKPDNSTITVDSDGILSSSGGSSYTFTNGLTENNGTVSWGLNDRIKAGTGTLSILEGQATSADNYGHAEGFKTSAGMFGHAEGYISGAYGSYSHAEGYMTQAQGGTSHAEGHSTFAIGNYSHAEGDTTLASSSTQHSEGKFNIVDQNGIFQHIAGNGASASARSTMFARDWNGNEYLSNNLYVGCNDFTTTANGLTTANAGGSKVATENYVDTAIANLPSGGGSSYTAGDGIDIDANGIISTTQKPPRIITVSSINNSNQYGAENRAYIGNAINNGLDNYPFIIDVSNYGNVERYIPIGRNTTQIKMFSITTKEIVNIGYVASNNMLAYSFQKLNSSYFPTGLSATNAPSGNASSNIGQELTYIKTNYATKTELPEGLPTAPTTDGTYMLKCVVSSGTPTYSWESVNVGGSY